MTELEPEEAVRRRARSSNASIGVIVNEWLHKDIQSRSQVRKLKVQ